MTEAFPVELLFLCGFAFLAGFIDAIVGGGGLIQIPALLVFLPDAAVASVLGTNKLASIAGTAAAIPQYAKRVEMEWRALLPAVVVAFAFSFLGARSVSLIDGAIVRPLILALLIAVAVYTFIRKDFGSLHAPRLSPTKQRWCGAAIGAALGFYDGFFGPGTGSFLIVAFVGVFGFDFLTAAASSKVVNTATNLSALLYFASTNHILYRVALPMAACNVLGSIVGARLAILKGSQFVRTLFLVVVTAFIIRLAYDVLKG
ncbi:MAG: TSUP family transporter [Burkholderiales bacterium]|nr:TSUP family transporter [Burkholderiales bacterium]